MTMQLHVSIYIERDPRLGGTPLILTSCLNESFGNGMCLVFRLHRNIKKKIGVCLNIFGASTQINYDDVTFSL